MGLFGHGKKKEQEPAACGYSCGGGCAGTPSPAAEDCAVLILGSGCENCRKLEENVRAALADLGKADMAVGHVTDFTEIAKYGVMRTPALVVDGQVVSSGRVLSKDEAAALLQKKNA